MIVIIGAKGQLGIELTNKLGKEARTFDHSQLDLTDIPKVVSTLQYLKPTWVINAAAYNAVDKAESERDLANKINAEAPAAISELSLKLGFKFVHVSTDYVFDGYSSRPYIETDPIQPINAYGKSKADGEKLVLDANPNSLIFRTSWVHSRNGKSFLGTVLRFAAENKPMRVISDSIGSPTWARDLADVIVQSKDLSGVFHFSNEGLCSWYDFAFAIRRFGNLQIQLTPVCSSEYPTPAKRPRFSLLDKSKIKNALGIQIPHWMESVEKCLSEQS